MKDTKGKPLGASLGFEYGDGIVLGGADDLGTDGRDVDEQCETTSRDEEAGPRSMAQANSSSHDRTPFSRVRFSVTKATSQRRRKHAKKITTPKNPASTRPS